MDIYRFFRQLGHVLAFIIMIVSLGVSCRAFAHDFWLEPTHFSLSADQPQSVSIFIGHPDEKIRWDLQPERLIAVRSFGADKMRDQFQYYRDGDPALTMSGHSEGVYWLTVETQDSISELPADRFNAYIEKENLTAIALHRIQKRTTQDAGIERYSRRAKTLVAVGDWTDTSDSHITQPLGLTLEIVPKANPLTAEPGAQVPLEVRYRGQALPGAQIKIIRLDGGLQDEEAIETVLTDPDGVATVIRPETGRWMYHVIWGSPLPDGYEQGYDTIFSSLTFSAD